jgi:leader peptidase (prepilin peptidase)/N-methyltransferase
VIISLFLLFIPLAVIDIKHQLIPDLFTLPGLAIGFLVSLFPGPITPVQSLLGIIAGGLPLFLVGWLGEKLFKKEEAMGGGDIKMMAAVGALLGPQTVLMALALGSVMGSVIGITLMLFKKLNKDRKIPFGPYLALGSVLAFFYGDRLLELYMRWIGTLVK